MGFDPLISLTAFPILAGLLCLIFPDRLKGATKAVSFLTAGLVFIGTIVLFVRRPVYCQSSFPELFSIDQLSVFIIMAVAFFAFIITIYSFGFIEKNYGRYFGYVLMTLGASLGTVLANNLILVLIFWGILALLLYLLINISNTDEAKSAAKKTLIIAGGTDSLMMLGIAIIWNITGSFSMAGAHIPLNNTLSYTAFFCLAIAAFAKAGVMPFHSWLPDVAQYAEAPVTAYLPASLDKLLGIYLLARISMNLFAMNTVANMTLLIVGAATIILAVMTALVQHDLKRLLGYHAVSQVGYMVLGIGTGVPIGMAGALFHMLNHAIYKSCLFLSAGSVEKKTKTTDLARLGGLSKVMPITFASFLIASLSISGVPPFNGFVSKWMIYQGIIESGSSGSRLWIVWLVFAMFGSALTLASFMKLLHAVFLGRPARDFSAIKESGLSISFPILVLAGLCIIFGVFAFLIPLPLFIIPSIKMAISYYGAWSPAMATILLLVGLAAGWLIYYFSGAKTFRSVGIFIGGEKPEGLNRVSGTEFYDTIKKMKGLALFYKKDEEGALDIYDQGKNLVSALTGILRYFHNGVLPTYLVWCLLGMIGIFLVIFFR